MPRCAIKVEFSMKLHDNQIMDWLEAECGEETVTAFGECLPDPIRYAPEEMIHICNQVLEKYNSALHIIEYAGKDDDGYFWRVKDSGPLYPTRG